MAGWGIIALAFIVPSGFYALDIAALAFIGICRILQGDLRQYRPFLKKPSVFFPILFYLYIFSGFFFSHNFGEALSTLSEKLPFLLYPLIIGCMSGLNDVLLHKACRAFVLSLIICLGAALLYAAGDMLITHVYTIQLGEAVYNKWNWYGLTRLFGDWHPSYVSTFCNLAIAVLMSTPALDKASPRGRGFTLAAFLFLSLCVFLLYSITGIITWCCLLFFFGCKWLLRKRLPIGASLGIALSVMALLAAFLYINPLKIEKIQKLKEKGWSATDRQDERTVLTIRMAKWTTYLDIFKSHAFFGTTAGDIKNLRKKAYEEKSYTDLASYNYNAHDQYIEMLTVYGIAGFSLFLAMLWAAWRAPGTGSLLLPFIGITLIAFTTESLLERQQGLNFFMFFYSLLTLRVVKSY